MKILRYSHSALLALALLAAAPVQAAPHSRIWVLRSLGFENVKLYAHSMNEYLADPGAPLKHGNEP